MIADRGEFLRDRMGRKEPLKDPLVVGFDPALRHVGGFDDIYELDVTGGLDPLLRGQ